MTNREYTSPNDSLGIEKCCCGDAICEDYWLVGVGKFCQGSGFSRGEAIAIVDALRSASDNTAVVKAIAQERERCAEIVEAFKKTNWNIPEGSKIGAQRSIAISLVLDSVLGTIRRDSK